MGIIQRDKPHKLRLPFWKKIIILLFGIIFSIIFLEMGLRLGGFIFTSLQEYKNLLAIEQKGTYRIMCLGESTTAGGNDSYSSQLEEVLNQRNIGIKFRVINKGVVAVNTTAIVSQLEENLNKYQPDMVTAMIGINDRYVKYYEDIPSANTVLFKKFRVYRLLMMAWVHLIDKIRKNATQNLRNNTIEAKARSSISSVGLKQDYEDTAITIRDEDELKEAINSSIKDERAFMRVMEYYRSLGKYDQFEKELENAIKLNPKNETAYNLLAGIYNLCNKFTQAEEAFKKAIELNPENDRTYQRMGNFYMNQKKYSQAEEVFKKAIKLNPQNSFVLDGLGYCYMYQGKYSQAEETFRKLIEFSPGAYRFWGGLAVLYETMGKPELAKYYYSKVNETRLEQLSSITINNYLRLKNTLDQKGIKLVCIGYPMRSTEPLKMIFDGEPGLIFVDNEKIFKDAIKKEGFKKYFSDIFAGDFGHCTPEGNRLIAENIADVIFKGYFNKQNNED